MRALVVLILLAAATPAGAQSTQFEVDQLRAQQQAAQQREVAQSNELNALQARLRTEQAVAEQQLARAPVRLPEPLYTGATPGPTIDPAKVPSIPDAILADSNRRVQDVVRKRR